MPVAVRPLASAGDPSTEGQDLHAGDIRITADCDRDRTGASSMTTRGFVGFVVDGQEKIGYNHSDSYPRGVGVDVLGWLRVACDHPEWLLEQVRALRVVELDSPPTPADMERLRELLPDVGSRELINSWSSWLGQSGGDPAAILRLGAIEDAADFPLESLVCEWGYLIDLDASVFEVYRGFQEAPPTEGRWAGRGADPALGDGYWAVQRVATWSLCQLPDEATFLSDLDEHDW